MSNEHLKETIEKIKKEGLSAYDALPEILKDNPMIAKAVDIEKYKGKIITLGIFAFSTIQRIKAIRYFEDEGVINDEQFAKLSASEKERVKKICYTISEYPERYAFIDDDLKYIPLVSAYTLKIIKEYKIFAKKYVEHCRQHDKHASYPSILDDYLLLFEDIKEEISWSKMEYKNRNKKHS